MKARTIALLWGMAGGMALAQTAPPSQSVAPVSKPTAANTAMTQDRPAAAASPMAPKAAVPAKKVPAKPAASAGKKKMAPTATAAKATLGKRDPFQSPVREQGVTGPACTTGKKCLAINSIVLRGIVKSQSGMIAVVESSARRISYFLRENDPVFNGYVVKITADTVVFRENVMDRLGKQGTHDVVMKVVAPAV